MITKAHAEAIAKKLLANIRSGKRAHDLAVVEHNGKRVTQFGIRRGSKKDESHDHIPGDLHLSPHNTLELARCPLSRDQWIEVMKTKGFIAK